MPTLKKLCEAYNLTIIEACAQSFGAHINGQQTGSFGDAGAFSFFPSKNLGCYGDGGLISTNSDKMAEDIKVLRNHGSTRQYHHTVIGYNSRLDELQAVILRTKLKRIDDYNANRRRVDQSYKAMLADTDVQTPFEDGTGYHVYHQYTCMHPQRDSIMQTLRDAGISCAIYYPVPLHKQEVFAQDCQDTVLPVTEAVVKNCFSLPVYPELTEDKIQLITDTIKTAL
jgi:dTDP-4-amino-4,6-dideoxygalactose transaminase